MKNFRNESGAFDMPSIIIGVIVVGFLTAGVLATVFGIVPFSQDKAAQQELAAVITAQNNTRALTAAEGPGVYKSKEDLISAGAISNGNDYNTKAGVEGECFTATARSKTGKVFWADSDDTAVKEYASGDVSKCGGLKKLAWDINMSNVMKTTWDTSAASGCSTVNVLVSGAVAGTIIDWGDGTTSTFPTLTTHTYATTKKKSQITVTGKFSSYGSHAAFTNGCLISVDEWGTATGTTNMTAAFMGANRLLHIEEIPAGVRNMRSMFFNATAFNQPISGWDTSEVTDMNSMFYKATAFNQPINNWDTSSVADMNSMFMFAKAFNQPISNWDTSGVTNMNDMFHDATAFNQPIGNWKTHNVTIMYCMFYGATSMSKDLSSWDVSSVTESNVFSRGSALTPAMLPRFR